MKDEDPPSKPTARPFLRTRSPAMFDSIGDYVADDIVRVFADHHKRKVEFEPGSREGFVTIRIWLPSGASIAQEAEGVLAALVALTESFLVFEE